MSAAALYNGGPPGAELAWSRGLHYGDGVFRTILVWQGKPVDMDRQLAVLHRDAQALELDTPPEALLRSEAAQLVDGEDRAVLKILLWRAASGRGYAPRGPAADRLLLRQPAPCYPAAHWQAGVRLAASALRLARQPRLAGIKHLNRLEQVLASAAPPQDAEEVFVCDARGHPVCGARTNLFAVREGELLTPRLNHCGVRGMMRDKIMELAVQLGIPVQVQHFDADVLARADEVFVSNSLIGLWPVRALAAHGYPAPGAITRRLLDALQHPRLC